MNSTKSGFQMEICRIFVQKTLQVEAFIKRGHVVECRVMGKPVWAILSDHYSSTPFSRTIEFLDGYVNIHLNLVQNHFEECSKLKSLGHSLGGTCVGNIVRLQPVKAPLSMVTTQNNRISLASYHIRLKKAIFTQSSIKGY